ncbi:hypothetical protein ACFL2V_07975 [Pseudomonadota bacterium]
MNLKKIMISFLAVFAVLSPVFASDVVIESKGMTVFGDDNGPKDLTLIPWKPQLPDSKLDGFAFSVSDDVFQPLDRKVFLRRVEYYQQVFSKPAASGK